jgi:hypothetical protein
MTDYTVAEVRQMLTQHSLRSDEFDPVEIAADLSERTEMNDGLDALLDPQPGSDPTAIDLSWTGPS